jgi:gas vesicle protein
MPTGTANTAEEITDNIRALVDRLVESKVTHEMARRGQDVASLLAERGADVGAMANDAWQESRPMRRDVSKQLGRTSRDVAKWMNRTWRKDVRPTLRDMWKRREVAIGAAGAAVPAAGEIVDTAAVRLGLKQQREERHWGAFFLGLLFGLAAGAIVALLTAPKRGDEMRRDLTERADEIATRAKDEWVPMFQRDETNGQPAAEPTTATISEGTADAGAASGTDADRAADEAAEAINEAFDGGAERETAEGEPSA